MSNKKYRAIVCALAFAASFPAMQNSQVYAAEAEADGVDAAAAEAPAEVAAAAPAADGAAAAADAAAAPANEAAAPASAAAPADTKSNPTPVDTWKTTRPEDKAIDAGMDAYAGKTIVSVELDGAGKATRPTALAALSTRTGDTFSKSAIDKDRNALYDTGYFYDLYPSFTVVPEGVIVTYHLLENPVLQGIEISGNTVEKTADIQKLLTVRTGEILNTKILHENVQAVEDLYHKDGYILVKFSDLDIGRDGKLKLVINEGTLEGYTVKGNTKTKSRVVLREMRQKTGEPFNAKKARRSMQRVYNLGFFEDVNMKLNPGVAPNAIVLEVDVVEKRTGTFSVGAGYSSQDGLIGMISVGDTNFRGTGDSVNLMYEFSGSQSDAHGYVFSYRKPWLDKKETVGTFRIYNRTYEYDDYGTNGNLIEEYMRKYSGGEITLGRPVSEYSTNFITLRNRDDRYIKHESSTNRSTEAYREWRDKNFGTTRSVTLEHVTDTRDNVYYPMAGGRVALTGEFAGFGAKFKYQKYTIEDQRYKKVGHAQVLALRLQYGHGNGDIPESALYKLGGQDSLRGYRDDQFRGRDMYLRTVEYRFPIVSKVQGALFTDFGAAWDTGWTPSGTHASVGVGVQIQTPVGPIRLDLGHGSQGNRVHFSVGGTF